MRLLAALFATLLLAGCSEPLGPDGGGPEREASADAVAALAATGSQFDYRYVYRVPVDRVKAVQDSHVDGCIRLGPSRCRITDQRYRTAGDTASAILTFRIDPVLARAFGAAATKVVTGSRGTLIETQMAGFDTTTAARSNAMIARLRDQLNTASAQAAAATDPSLRAQAQLRGQRIRAALDMIAEVEAGQGQTLATAPVLITYASGPAVGGGAAAQFANAGTALMTSLSGMAELLAGIAPWLIVMGIAVFILRRLIHGSELGGPAPEGARIVTEPMPEPRKSGLFSDWARPDAADKRVDDRVDAS